MENVVEIEDRVTPLEVWGVVVFGHLEERWYHLRGAEFTGFELENEVEEHLATEV